MSRSVANSIPSSSIPSSRNQVGVSLAKNTSAGFSKDTKYNATAIIKNLEEFSDRLEITHELGTYIETLEKSLREASAKQAEIEAMEYLAWTSDEPAVVEARKSLFFAVKLVHGEFLAEYNRSVKEHIIEQASGKSDEYETGYDPVEYISEKDWKKHSYSFLQWIKDKVWAKARTKKNIHKITK
jgi:hypothetical protein